MSLVEQLERIEERMEHSFLQNRFDTFNQLASERLLLLKRAQQSPEKDAVLALASVKTEQWVALLGQRIKEFRQTQSQSHALGGYGTGSSRAGRVVNRSL